MNTGVSNGRKLIAEKLAKLRTERDRIRMQLAAYEGAIDVLVQLLDEYAAGENKEAANVNGKRETETL